MSGELNKAESDDSKHLPLVVLLATKTAEKIEHLNTAARIQRWPIHFIGMNEIRDAFVSALEDTGCSYENAIQKMECTADVLLLCKQKGPFRDALKKRVCALNIVFNPERILFASEDSTMHMDPDVWRCLRPKLRPFVPEELLIRAEGNKGDPGLGAETGPILGAVTIPLFMKLLYEAGQDLGYGEKPVALTDKVDLLYRRLVDSPESPLKHLKVEVPLMLTQQGLEAGYKIRLSREPVVTGYFLSSPSNPEMTLSDHFRDYLSGESARAKTVRGLAERYSLDGKVDQPHLQVVRPSADLSVREVDLRLPSVLPEVVAEGDAYYRYLNITPLLETADAYVFRPFDANNPVLKRWAYYTLFATMVAKQTEAWQMNKPIIVMDDGCWRDARHLEIMLSNMGMVKNYRRHPFFDAAPFKTVIPDGVRVVSTAYVDYVIGNKEKALEDAKKELLRRRGYGFYRYHSPGDLSDSVEYSPPWLKENPPCVSAYTSAGSDNVQLWQRNYMVGKHSAQLGWGVIYGGGDQHAMGAFYNGYMREGGHFIAGYTTPSIVKSETERGYLPDCHIWGLCPDVSARRTHFAVMGDIHYATWGGLGTVEELLSFAVLRDAFPSFSDRTIIVDAARIHGKDGWYNPIALPGLEMLYGQDPTNDHRAFFKEHGVLISKSIGETFNKIDELAGRVRRPSHKRFWAGPAGEHLAIDLAR